MTTWRHCLWPPPPLNCPESMYIKLLKPTHGEIIFPLFIFFDTLWFSSSAPPAEIPPEPTDPCIPSPCGLNSQCRNINGVPSCSCLSQFIGVPPNCRPECLINPECPSNKACIKQTCRDPCVGSCGLNALCHVNNHVPICTCYENYVGDPFSECHLKPPERKCLSFYIII